MADAAGMMCSIYVTSVIRYDSFVALASKNVTDTLLQMDGSADVWWFVGYGKCIKYNGMTIALLPNSKAWKPS